MSGLTTFSQTDVTEPPKSDGFSLAVRSNPDTNSRQTGGGIVSDERDKRRLRDDSFDNGGVFRQFRPLAAK